MPSLDILIAVMDIFLISRDVRGYGAKTGEMELRGKDRSATVE